MKTKKIVLPIVLLFVVAILLLAGCAKKEKPEKFVQVEEEVIDQKQEEVIVQKQEEAIEQPKEEVTEPSPAEAVPKPEEPLKEVFRSGVVTYISGDVSVDRGSGWEVLDVDDYVDLEDRLKTEPVSFCELQFTDFGIIRIQEDTEVAIADVYLVEEQNRVKVKLEEGKLLCKVRKLGKGDEFQVRTSTALAGVRGTEFMVEAKKDESVHFAVKEGAVSVVPLSVADKIEEIRENLKTETAKDILDEVNVPEIIVTEDKEVTVRQEEVQQAAEEFEPVSKVIENKIKKIDEKARVVEAKERKIESLGEGAKERDIRDVREMKEDIVSLKQEVISTTTEKAETAQEVFQKPKPVSEPSVKVLDEIKKMETKEFVIAAKAKEKEEVREKKPAYTKLTIKTEPKDAIIYINGDQAGRGKFRGLYLPETSLRIRVEKEGYISEEREFKVPGEASQTIKIELKNSPLAWSMKVGKTPFVRKIVSSGNRLVIADVEGRVFCLSPEGKRLWSFESSNRPNNNSMPVVVRNMVLFSGSRELVVLDLNTGKEHKRVQIGTGDYSSHIFGRRVTGFNGSVIYPSNSMLLLLELSNLQETYRIALPENANSSPAVYKDSILIVDQKGGLLRINPLTGEITQRIQSNALQPVSIAPSIVGDGAVFAGRDGTTVYVDLASNEKKWEKKLDLGGGSGIFQDIGASEKAVYPFTGTQFYALDRESGKTLFNPVRSTCPPLYYDGKLYFGDQQRRLLILDALSGKTLKTYPLESAINLEPAIFEGDVVVATQSGTIYRLRPLYM